MKQGGTNALVAQAYFLHHNPRYGNRVQYIRLAAAPAHPFVCGVRKIEGFLHQLELVFACTAALRGLHQQGKVIVYYLAVLPAKFTLRLHNFSCIRERSGTHSSTLLPTIWHTS